ncbi:MAG: cysteine desulfurase [Candidatus Vogelbacteria bacterium]|nr:cysteine desulfurase [Candidatus Vogelbacteria bacterium]
MFWKQSKRIYLDYAAAAPIRPEVLTTMEDCSRRFFANPSSIHLEGDTAKKAFASARARVAALLQVKPSEIVFSGSGTESCNLAIFGLARANKTRGKHIIISALEHKAVLEPALKLRDEGFEVEILPLNSRGIASTIELEKMLRSDTILVSIMHANNEIGTIQPVHEIGNIIRKFNESKTAAYSPLPTACLFHIDACQSFNYLNVFPNSFNCDALSLNSSKVGGPKGVGLLFLKHGTKIEPIIFGGGQEGGLRSGTENLTAILGFAKALELAKTERESESVRLTELRQNFAHEILTRIQDSKLNGDPDKRLPNNVNISFAGIDGEELVLNLDDAGVACSTGSACSLIAGSASHVLKALGQNDTESHESVRFTLGHNTTKKELDVTVSALEEIIKRLRSYKII